MDYKDISQSLLSLEAFEEKLNILSSFHSCKAKLLFFAIRDNLDDISEFDNFVEGSGIIDFTFLNGENEVKYFVDYAHIKGFDINIELEYENYKIYAKQYIEEISEKINMPIDVDIITPLH